MLIGLGFLMIAVFMYLILSKRLTPVVALILVPVVFGIAAVQFGAAVVPEDGGVTDSIMDAIKSFAPTAALLFFAIIYFGLMIDVGLFDPLIRLILRVVGNSPVRLVIGTAVLAGMVSLDGDGSTTFIITVSALLPIYLKLGMSPVVLTVVACLANGVLNIVPWGGPTVRAATVLKVSPERPVHPDGARHDRGDGGRPGAGLPDGPLREEATAELRPHPGIGRRVPRRRAGRRRRQRRRSSWPRHPAAPSGWLRRPGAGLRGRQLRHGIRARPGAQDPAPEADLVQPRR